MLKHGMQYLSLQAPNVHKLWESPQKYMFSLVKPNIPQDFLAWNPSHSQTHSFKKSSNACYVPGTITVTEGLKETYSFNIYFQRELFEAPS